MQATDILFMGREYFSMVAMLPQIPACMIHAPQCCGVRRVAPLFYRNSVGMMTVQRTESERVWNRPPPDHLVTLSPGHASLNHPGFGQAALGVRRGVLAITVRNKATRGPSCQVIAGTTVPGVAMFLSRHSFSAAFFNNGRDASVS